MKLLRSLADLPREEIVDLLALASRLAREGDPQALAGKILGLLFFNPSLRTLASMQAAMAKLGGSSFVVTPGGSSWKLETRTGVVMNGEASEHVREAIPVLAGYADVITSGSIDDDGSHYWVGYTADGAVHEALVYLYNWPLDGLPRIADGRFDLG